MELPFGSRGIDLYGVSKDHLLRAGQVLTFAYRHYFRVRTVGAEHVPPRGRAMLVSNHSGGYAIDAGMLAAACFLELEPPRLAHGMVDKFINRLPFVSTWSNRVGQFVGLPEHARRLLSDERLLMVFPEGARGTAKLYKDRHKLVRFGTGFVRLALETKTPIVPVAVLGGGEAVPTIKNFYALGKLIGLPYIPVTPYLLALPLPAHIGIRFGEPMLLEGDPAQDDVAISELVQKVKGRIAQLIAEGQEESPAR